VSAGAGATSWDGRDASGRPVADGLYLARLTSRDRAAVARVTILN